MQKRIFIVHGWGGHPGEGWFPWLKKELEGRDFEVRVPAMPDTEEPRIEAWVAYLKRVVGDTDENTYFIGHSIGCQTIMRYLETIDEKNKVGGAVFVAGWFSLMNLPEGEKPIAKPWLERPIDFDKVRKYSNKFIAIFSDNDPVVPQENKSLFEERLGAKTIMESGKGHFSGDDNVTELPSAFTAVLEISSEL